MTTGTTSSPTPAAPVARSAAPVQVGRVAFFRRKRLLRALALAFMLTYTVVTLFPFYVLFVRTFVSTKESTTLHLWIPKNDDVSLDAQVGNLAVNFNLDLRQVKEDLGIKGYVNPRAT